MAKINFSNAEADLIRSIPVDGGTVLDILLNFKRHISSDYLEYDFFHRCIEKTIQAGLGSSSRGQFSLSPDGYKIFHKESTESPPEQNVASREFKQQVSFSLKLEEETYKRIDRTALEEISSETSDEENDISPEDYHARFLIIVSTTVATIGASLLWFMNGNIWIWHLPIIFVVCIILNSAQGTLIERGCGIILSSFLFLATVLFLGWPGTLGEYLVYVISLLTAAVIITDSIESSYD